MKKLIFSAAVVAASVFGVYTANQNNAMALMSDLQMEDIEALGQLGDAQNPSMIDHMWYVGNHTADTPEDIVKVNGMGGSYYEYSAQGPNLKQVTVVLDCQYTTSYSLGFMSSSQSTGPNPKTVQKCGYGTGGCVDKTCLDYL